MVREQLQARGIRDPATLAALGRVPREAFVATAQRHLAYADRALPIGREQTISQPYMVALMTQALGFTDDGWPWMGTRPTFLDVGTGSGYQAAVLAQIGAQVVSVERDPQLGTEARERLAQLGYNVEVIIADGSIGLADRAPYAGIVVGAGAPSVPKPLVEQLADGGRLVIPVGDRSSQRLMVVQRVGPSTRTTASDQCVFVPLVGSRGHPG
jgi:protein-L-isoaspartate(D-aspartate) O-methyltransferase